MKFDSDRLDEIVDLMLETVCTARKRVRIAGDDYPAELVKSKFMKLDGEHIRFVLDCMRENTTKIRNIKQYLKAALFNAPSTIGNYYTSLVAHDMASGALSPKKPQYGDPDYYSCKPGEKPVKQQKEILYGTENDRSNWYLTSAPTVTTFALT